MLGALGERGVEDVLPPLGGGIGVIPDRTAGGGQQAGGNRNDGGNDRGKGTVWKGGTAHERQSANGTKAVILAGFDRPRMAGDE
jgi:hypothetical protein